MSLGEWVTKQTGSFFKTLYRGYEMYRGQRTFVHRFERDDGSVFEMRSTTVRVQVPRLRMGKGQRRNRRNATARKARLALLVVGKAV